MASPKPRMFPARCSGDDFRNTAKYVPEAPFVYAFFQCAVPGLTLVSNGLHARLAWPADDEIDVKLPGYFLRRLLRRYTDRRFIDKQQNISFRYAFVAGKMRVPNLAERRLFVIFHNTAYSNQR